ncbi:MAG: hypothetical protein IJ214_02525 [Clostridia bacterium]|nr:hypothetical protein [Clostridia bacterium]
MGKYDDILYLARPISKKHAPMPRSDRAKQFMPFAALKGYDDAISQKQVVYEPRMELGDEQRDRLDAALLRLHETLRAGGHPRVAVLCFVPRPDGIPSSPPLGQYLSFAGVVQRMNLENQRLQLDGQWLPLADIIALTEEG